MASRPPRPPGGLEIENVSKSDGAYRHAQWGKEDFVPIASAIDKIMAEKGWR